MYIWFSMVLLPCLGANQQGFEEKSGKSLIAFSRNEISESESTKQVRTIGMVASIAVILIGIGAIQPLLLTVPLAIAWIGLSIGLALLSQMFFNDGDRTPDYLRPLEFLLFFAGALIASPFYALYLLLIEIDIL